MEISELKYRLRQDIETVVEHLLPLGKRQKNEYCVGSIAGEAGDSLRIHLTGNNTGVWCDFATGEKGDIIALWAQSRGIMLGPALDEIRQYLGLPKKERKRKAYRRPQFPPYEREQTEALRYLTNVRKLSEDTLAAYAVEWDDKDIIFPSFKDDELIAWKKLGIYRPEGKKRIMSSPGAEPILFGWQAVNFESRSLIICEGEIDALSFYEYGFHATVSLPFGGGRGDKQQWIENEKDTLEQFDTIFLAVDDDYEGYVAAREIVMSLGQHRCKLVTLPFKDCNECLAQGVERVVIEAALQNASTVSIEQLRSMAPSNEPAPPHNTELEQFILSWFLNDNPDRHIIFSNLEETDFYWPAHQMIFRAARDLHKAGQSLGVVNIIDRLVTLKVYGDVVSRGHLDDLRLIIPGMSIPEVCETIRGMKTMRMLQDIGNEIRIITNTENNSTKACSQVQQAIISVTNREAQRGRLITLAEAMAPVVAQIEDNIENPSEIRGTATGFHRIDRLLHGMKNSQLIIAAARPGMGKTAYILNILNHIMLIERKPCVFFSLEMSREEIIYRLLAIYTGITTKQMHSGKLNEKEYNRLLQAQVAMADAPLAIEDASHMTPDKVQLIAERMKIQYGSLALVAVDYLQLMDCDDRRRDMQIHERVSKVSSGLKRAAKELQCPLIAAAQLSRQVELRQDKKPMLSDLRDSGNIEADADVVKFLYRDDYYDKKSEKPGIAEVIIAKQRDGELGNIDLIWDAPCTRFRNVAAPKEAPEF